MLIKFHISVLLTIAIFLLHHFCSVYEKFEATRAKVAPVNLTYGSHSSATGPHYKVSQNIENFVE